MTDVKAIADGLSEAQRACVKVLGAEFKTPPRGHAYWAGTLLYNHKLTRFRYADTRTGKYKRLYSLTDLGLAVRKHLSDNTGERDI